MSNPNPISLLVTYKILDSTYKQKNQKVLFDCPYTRNFPLDTFNVGGQFNWEVTNGFILLLQPGNTKLEMHRNILREVISLYHQDMSKNQQLELIKFTLNHLCLNFIASLLFGGWGAGNRSETWTLYFLPQIVKSLGMLEMKYQSDLNHKLN